MNTPKNRRPIIAFVIAAVLGAAAGQVASAVAAVPPMVDEDMQTCAEFEAPDGTVAPEDAIHAVSDMPPSDFLRGAGRTAPIPH